MGSGLKQGKKSGGLLIIKYIEVSKEYLGSINIQTKKSKILLNPL